MRHILSAFVVLAFTAEAAAQEDLTPPPSTGTVIPPRGTGTVIPPTGTGTETDSETGTETDSETETGTETVSADHESTDVEGPRPDTRREASPPTASASAAATDTPPTLADALGDPRYGPSPSPSEDAPDETPEGAPEDEPWAGPAVELGYTHYNLSDAFGGGDVHAGSFGGFLPFHPIRIGGWAELGVREYALGDDDLIVRANVIAGYQYLGWRPFAPYAGVTGTVGVTFGERFASAEAWGFGGAGIELGAEVNLVRNLWAGLSVGYQRVSMAGLGFDLWVFRARMGL